MNVYDGIQDALTFYNSGRYNEADALLAGINDPAALSLRAAISEKSGSADAAIGYLEQVVERDPAFDGALLKLGVLHTSKSPFDNYG